MTKLCCFFSLSLSRSEIERIVRRPFDTGRDAFFRVLKTCYHLSPRWAQIKNHFCPRVAAPFVRKIAIISFSLSLALSSHSGSFGDFVPYLRNPLASNWTTASILLCEDSVSSSLAS